jgi:hypothetical protein
MKCLRNVVRRPSRLRNAAVGMRSRSQSQSFDGRGSIACEPNHHMYVTTQGIVAYKCYRGVPLGFSAPYCLGYEADVAISRRTMSFRTLRDSNTPSTTEGGW